MDDIKIQIFSITGASIEEICKKFSNSRLLLTTASRKDIPLYHLIDCLHHDTPKLHERTLGDLAVVFVPDTRISTSMPLFSVKTPSSFAFSVRYFAPAGEEETLVLKTNVILFARNVGIHLFFSGRQFDRL